MEEQAQFWRISITEYIGLFCVAILSSGIVITATLPLVIMVSITGWQMFFIALYNLVTKRK